MERVARAIIIICIALAIIMTVQTVKADTAAVCVVHKGEWVWVRSGPDQMADKIEKIRYGYDVEISEIKNGYAHITWATMPKKTGWVDVSYLEIPIKEKIYLVISDGPLNVRETPEGRFLRKIKSGARVSVLGWRYSKKGELWAKVYMGGYVKAEFLAQTEEVARQ